MAKKKWRRRTHGTPNQIGKAFPLEESSMQSRKARLPKPSIWIRGNPLRLQWKGKSDEEKLADDRKKRFKELNKKNEREVRMFGLPVRKSDNQVSSIDKLRFKLDPETEFSDGNEELREEIDELKDKLHDDKVYAVVEVKREFKPISERLRENRFFQWLNRKTEGYRRKRQEKSKLP